ncbi:MAG TPA: hypothetical protein VMG98_04420 [Verrucomicrobiae bacterium]|nr:hypothetical protein [Verrucomicrobiae bacterium]
MDELQGRPALRALSIGEIFDRAVTMYVRHFAVFTLIVLTLLVPIGILDYFVTDRSTSQLSQLLAQISHPGAHNSVLYSPSQLSAISAVALLTLLLAPFTNNAVAVGVAAIYAGRAPTYAGGYERVLRRWAPLLGTTILCGLILLATYVAVVFGAFIVAFTVTLLAVAARFFIVLFAIVGLVAVLAILLLFVLLVMCCAFALYASTIEEARPADAIGEAFRRLFNRREIGKATLISLAYLAIQIGAFVIGASLAALLLSFAHSSVLELAVETVINAAVTAFVTILLATYYYDVRTRSEGLDLEVDLERLTAPS